MPSLDRDIAHLPNIRKMFLPDRGFMIFDADLSGADAQVVAWDAGDEDLKSAFRSGLDVHTKNATDMLGDSFTNLDGPARKRKRQENKVAVHASNYGASARTLAINLSWSVAQAANWQFNWFRLHPNIKTWHNRIRNQLYLPTHSVSNAFGYRRIYFDRPDSILPEALAWIPQSTVAETCFRGALQLRRACPWVQMLLQVHDSLVFQVPFTHADKLDEIRAGLRVTVPYPDPLTIPWKLARSAKSWGDCKEI